jgi:hypothetical protein
MMKFRGFSACNLLTRAILKLNLDPSIAEVSQELYVLKFLVCGILLSTFGFFVNVSLRESKAFAALLVGAILFALFKIYSVSEEAVAVDGRFQDATVIRARMEFLDNYQPVKGRQFSSIKLTLPNTWPHHFADLQRKKYFAG